MKKRILIISIALLVIIIIGLIVPNIFNHNTEPQNSSNNTTTPSSTPLPTPINSAEDMTEQEKSIFNSRFDIYGGSSVSEEDVKSLLKMVNASNSSSTIRKVSLTIDGNEVTDPQSVNSSSLYTVKFEYDESKLICNVIVTTNVQ